MNEMNRLTSSITTVLLDLDGTLLDSNDAHARAWVSALEEFGIIREYRDVRKLIGMGSDHLLPALTDLSSEDAMTEKISKRRGEIFRSHYLYTLQPFPGARDLVIKIKTLGLKPVVATSASAKDVAGLLEQIGIEDLIDLQTTSDDADHSKPSPDILVAALAKAKAQPREAIMIGDTRYDIEAAKKAGVATIGFTCGGWSGHDLADAIEIYEGPADLVKRIENSVLWPRK